MMSDKRKREVFRYLSGPPVSEDDLKVLMQARSLAPKTLRTDPELLARVVAFMRDWHDRRRFPWVTDEWEPQEHDRNAAILATTELLAMRRVETLRRHEGKKIQERRVEQQLIRTGYKKVDTRRIRTLRDAPKAGEFCRETLLGDRKADFVIGMWDGRTMGLECKVSNSSRNSVKRLNNDAVVKAESWRQDFGTTQGSVRGGPEWGLQGAQPRKRPTSRPDGLLGARSTSDGGLDSRHKGLVAVVCQPDSSVSL